MVYRPILKLGHPLLRQPAESVSPTELQSPDTQQLIDDLIETMHNAQGAGLAAPQVGVSLRICVFEVNENPRYPWLPTIELTTLINPQVSALPTNDDHNAIEMYEGCLSIPGLRGKVRRSRLIDVDALDRTGASIHVRYEGAAAAVVQHEVDHLDGTLFVDRADTQTLTFETEYNRFIPLTARFWDGGNSL